MYHFSLGERAEQALIKRSKEVVGPSGRPSTVDIHLPCKQGRALMRMPTLPCFVYLWLHRRWS